MALASVLSSHSSSPPAWGEPWQQHPSKQPYTTFFCSLLVICSGITLAEEEMITHIFFAWTLLIWALILFEFAHPSVYVFTHQLLTHGSPTNTDVQPTHWKDSPDSNLPEQENYWQKYYSFDRTWSFLSSACNHGFQRKFSMCHSTLWWSSGASCSLVPYGNGTCCPALGNHECRLLKAALSHDPAPASRAQKQNFPKETV